MNRADWLRVLVIVTLNAASVVCWAFILDWPVERTLLISIFVYLVVESEAAGARRREIVAAVKEASETLKKENAMSERTPEAPQ